MSYSVELARSAERELWRIPEPARSKIYRSIRSLTDDPRPTGSKKLVGHKNGWRLRIGNYRVLYTIRDVVRIVRVESVGHRKDVYRSKK